MNCKSILISIRPEHCYKILNKEKLLEIRKSIPKCDLPCKVYIYCTKSTKYALYCINNRFMLYKGNKYQVDGNMCCGTKLNGKVVAEFILNKYDFLIDCGFGVHYADQDLKDLDLDHLRTNSCLTDEQIYQYLGFKKNSGYYNDGYAWHINNLKIYEKPKTLSDFIKPCKHLKNEHCYLYSQNCKKLMAEISYKNNVPYQSDDHICGNYIEKPPQSWCYVEALT